MAEATPEQAAFWEALYNNAAINQSKLTEDCSKMDIAYLNKKNTIETTADDNSNNPSPVTENGPDTLPRSFEPRPATDYTH